MPSKVSIELYFLCDLFSILAFSRFDLDRPSRTRRCIAMCHGWLALPIGTLWLHVTTGLARLR
jgi:hypothetical protein